MKRARPARQSGFSLVETVAAMGILSIAAIPLLQISTDATRNASRLETRLLARTVAENVLSRTLASPSLLEGGVVGGTEIQLGREFSWLVISSPPKLGDVQNLEVTVTVGDDEQVLARLIGLKANPFPVEALAPPESDPPEELGGDEDGEDKAPPK